LQDGQVLPFAQACDLHDLPVGEFQRIMMRMGIFQVYLPEPSHLLPDLPEPQAR